LTARPAVRYTHAHPELALEKRLVVPPYVRLARILKTFYAHVTRMSWDALGGLVAAHFALAFLLMREFETGEITEAIAFWYFYVTTATTVGYGDVTPKTEAGRLLTTFWIMPGGIVLFTVSIAKFVQFISDRWRRRMRGEADYSYLTNHVVILGWQGRRTAKVVDEIVGDVGADAREIVLCTTKDIENPLPDVVKFVRDHALNTAGLQNRAALRGAAVIIALGHDDNDTLAAALAAGAVNRHAHIVAYFEQQAFADLLVAHCPRAEAMVSMSMEMLVRAAQDPGSSRIQQDLLSVVGGQTQFSLTLPAAARETTYGELLAQFKSRHDATLIAVATDCNGTGLELNAAAECRVGPGCVVYYIAATRIRHDQLQWLSAAPSPALSAARA
jgi:voltage-gated potassium channel